ncbi:hypothetical protein PHYSODRAFT_321312 [Phytophthora sojae]|uniref:BZIP domain-containing protein n=2 Tax=Phytophthora TaxID=4783 RepID=G4YIC8_PHYSP|nr:hypothetical protein PHYSODRAFT_321312 [Phytophthora sojae]EGZ27511.1 hypothetical protein PHYSODRAFT_321312 [Phytophthora sojae]|eukprot:XP_009514786.1 hypothetical protein PHYSODRAFT_321312 [Phytophthora sojae]
MQPPRSALVMLGFHGPTATHGGQVDGAYRTGSFPSGGKPRRWWWRRQQHCLTELVAPGSLHSTAAPDSAPGLQLSLERPAFCTAAQRCHHFLADDITASRAPSEVDQKRVARSTSSEKQRKRPNANASSTYTPASKPSGAAVSAHAPGAQLQELPMPAARHRLERVRWRKRRTWRSARRLVHTEKRTTSVSSPRHHHFPSEPPRAESTRMKEVASLPRTPTMAAAAAPPPAADVTADMELMGATNRDMFSWLLFNSENMTAPAGVHPPAGMDHAHTLATSMALDDPFRMLGPGDDTSLPLALHPTTSAPLIQTGALTVALPASTPATTTAPATMAAPTKPAPTQRGKKRSAAEAAADVARDLHGKPLTNTEGLLRHLESANNALVQKRQAVHSGPGAAVAAAAAVAAPAVKSPKTEKAPPSSSGSDNNGDLTSLQRKLKLERNRESARECRRRKREHILGVEERCRQLERENMELRGQLKAGKEAIRQEEKEKNRVCEELEKMIQRGASEKELAEKIDNFKEQYSDYGHGRRSALSYHLHQIERLLLPTQVTKMCIWALRQDDSFWQDEEDETSLPVILAKELGLSEDQKKKIQQQRGSISLICENLKSALGLLAELKTEVTNKNSTLDMEMDKLQNILTPTQRAKFIVWVTNNQACMHLLNKLWRSVL